MDEAKQLLQSLCSHYHYCVVDLELEECAVTFLFSMFLAGSSLRLILTHQLYGTNSELYKLQDDFFDVVIFRIFGSLLLLLVYLSYKWQYDTLQVDVVVLELMVAFTAFAVNNNMYTGFLFTTLSYSSWYGWFRLLMTCPIEGNYYVLLQPQWIAALLLFTSPALISNLKYPALIDGTLARVAYGTTFFGLLVGMNASFLFIDAGLVYYDTIPNYAATVFAGAGYRLYGMRLDPLTRVGYYSAMIVLQFITCKIPHLMLNENHLLEQLQEQETEEAEQREILQEIRTKRKSDKAKKTEASKALNGEAAGGNSKDTQATGNSDIQDTADTLPPMQFVGDSELPADCVEISAEHAIELQERSLHKATKTGSPLS